MMDRRRMLESAHEKIAMILYEEQETAWDAGVGKYRYRIAVRRKVPASFLADGETELIAQGVMATTEAGHHDSSVSWAALDQGDGQDAAVSAAKGISVMQGERKGLAGTYVCNVVTKKASVYARGYVVFRNRASQAIVVESDVHMFTVPPGNIVESTMLQGSVPGTGESDLAAGQAEEM